MDRKKCHIVCFALLASLCFSLVACQPQAPDEKALRRQAVDPQMKELLEQPVAWSLESDCVVCHSAEHHSQEDSAYQMSATGHEGLTCIDCHDDEAGLQKAHEGLTHADFEGADRLKITSIPQETCLECHADDYSAELTSDSLLVDNNGKSINPHDVPATESHDALACSSCHKMHSGLGTLETAEEACRSCHHSNVYECRTCHQ